jgi:hypothetical protein
MAVRLSPEEREVKLAEWLLARKMRLEAEALSRMRLCEEQALAHELWGHAFPEHPYGH